MSPRPPSSPLIMATDPPVDFNGIDTAVHGPVRLGILSALKADGETLPN